MSKFTDIKLIAKFIPRKFHPYIYLLRLDRPTGYILLFIPCVLGIMFSLVQESSVINYGELLKFISLFGGGAIIMRSFGCIINDIVDRKLDATVARTKNRPLANGDISVMTAVIIAFILLCLGFLVLCFLPIRIWFIASLILPLVIIYPFTKYFFIAPQLWLGIIFNWGFIVGYFCFSDKFTKAAMIFYLSLILWTFIYDTIYAMADRNEDIKYGVKSSAILLRNKIKLLLIIGYCTEIFAIIYAVFLIWQQNILYIFVLLIPFWHLVRQIKNFSENDKASNYINMFKSNQWFGFLLILALWILLMVKTFYN